MCEMDTSELQEVNLCQIESTKCLMSSLLTQQNVSNVHLPKNPERPSATGAGQATTSIRQQFQTATMKNLMMKIVDYAQEDITRTKLMLISVILVLQGTMENALVKHS